MSKITALKQAYTDKLQRKIVETQRESYDLTSGNQTLKGSLTTEKKQK